MLAGLLVRLFYYRSLDGLYHPDELFQYVEPAFWKSSGHGHLAWEFRHGARNYTLSGFYFVWIQLGSWLGLGSYQLLRAIWFVDLGLSLLLIPAGWRIGAALGLRRGRTQLAVLVAAACALFPVFGYFGFRTLSELHGLLLITWATALWLELRAGIDSGRRQAALIGLLLGVALVARYALVAFVPVIALDMVLSRRWRRSLVFCAAAVTPLLIVGLADWVEWGTPFQTLYVYFKRNIFEGYAKTHGDAPARFYLDLFVDLFGSGGLLLLLGVALGLLVAPRLALATLVPLLIYTIIDHKEIRFLLPWWPLGLALAFAGLVELHARLSARLAAGWPEIGPRLRQLGQALALLLLFSPLWISRDEVSMWQPEFDPGYFHAQAHVSEQADASGLLVGTTRFYTGGYTLIRRNIPFEFFKLELARHRLFNYVAVDGGHEINLMMKEPGFQVIGKLGKVWLFKRTGS